jgi:hypothetical protein
MPVPFLADVPFGDGFLDFLRRRGYAIRRIIES